MDSQKVRVTKQFSFDMAHALHGYDGLCKNIHGHTYQLSVCLLGVPLNDKTHSKNGMVIDFSDLKHIVKEQVVNLLDHALVLNGDSPHAELKGLKENFERVVFVTYQPTCENLLLDIVGKLKEALKGNVSLYSVKLLETPTSYAEWYATDNPA